jgi:hypothetical protein
MPWTYAITEYSTGVRVFPTVLIQTLFQSNAWYVRYASIQEQSHDFSLSAITVASRFLLLAGLPSVVSAQVNLDRYTPSDALMPFSLYTTDSIYLPPGSSGLSDSGWTGTAGGAFFEPGAALRSPYLSVAGNLTVGDNSGTIRKLNVGGVLKLGNSITLADTVSVHSAFSNTSMDLTVNGPAFFSGNAAFTGARNRINSVVRAGGTASGGTLGPSGSLLSNQTFPGGCPRGCPWPHRRSPETAFLGRHSRQV